VFYVLSGTHPYRFEPSKITPGSTRFVNSEEFARLNNFFMRFMPMEKMFYQFCEQFKARVESVKAADLTSEAVLFDHGRK
jgi:hypothetical protein